MKKEIIEIFLGELEKICTTDEVPSFSMIFQDSEILASAYNLVEEKQNTNYHSEILAIEEALQKRNKKFLNNSVLLTTLEPCLMCAGAIILARIDEVWYFAEQTKQAGISSLNIETIYKLNHFPKLRFIRDEKIELKWKIFFNKLRKKTN